MTRRGANAGAEFVSLSQNGAVSMSSACQAAGLTAASNPHLDQVPAVKQRGDCRGHSQEMEKKEHHMSGIVFALLGLGSLIAMLSILLAADSCKVRKPKRDSSGRCRAIINGEYIDFDEQERINSFVED
ncbi:MAG: hypothetical protein IAC42_02380 [Spirochaetes bacterium]|uniref:Uncharacterized protein n=1 Tax=Candidatus Aphodenecus pullistercoris TaxID=2840669 RepID=A0A9D9E763_9SPIR|nr:hypothetical protein [Candidatus Aphodenecus pullistercoris]